MRNPKLPKLKAKHYRDISDLICRGDIILTRTDGYISTWMVPGFFTHAGVYVGMLDGEDQRVVEAIGEGVVHTDLIDFLREDYVVVIRPQYVPKVMTVSRDGVVAPTFIRAVERAVNLIGKVYDHVFDFADESRISCTELVQTCYKESLFGRRRFGRYTVVADDILRYAEEFPSKFTVEYDSRKEG